MRIGLDIGGVIIDRVKNGQFDTSFKTVDYTNTPPVKDAFFVIKELTNLFGPENIFLVSVCDETTEQKTNEWLEGNKFFDATNMKPENLYNCRERTEKAVIAKKLGLTHFVDDRPDVLEYMIETVPYLYLFDPESNQQEGIDPTITIIHEWKEALPIIKATLV